MKLVLQRVTSASVSVNGDNVGKIGPGLLVLLGFGAEDDKDLPSRELWGRMLKKMIELRIFADEDGKLNQSLLQQGGEVLLVSQFTLYADCRKGRRPSFHPAAPPETAEYLYTRFARDLEDLLPGKVQTGMFGEEMEVSLVNHGPVTIILSDDIFG